MDKEKVRGFPDSPGVYIMKNAGGKVIYVGKARSLRKRALSYFTISRLAPKTERLVSGIEDIEYIKTGSEAEALILEAGLIKSHRPRYNIELKDDKSYPYLKLTLGEKFPRLLITRRVERDGAAYYGPYTDAKLLRDAVSFMRRLFPLRLCRKMSKKVCTNYHLSQCRGPCAGKITKASYSGIVRDLRFFLEGRRTELIRELSRQMEKAAKGLNFEEAALIRNTIRSLSTVVTKRSCPGPMDQIDELRYVLGLKRRPVMVEAFDVSNISGKEAVGSMVSFSEGEPDKARYRKYRIERTGGRDDYMMMREVVRRRYARLLEEKKGLPDLVIIDGGKGHLSGALKEMKALGISHVPAIGIAKEFEHICVPGRRLPVILPKDSSVLQLIRRIRDEAHRFAKSYHTRLRRRTVSVSELDGIEGVGPVLKKRLVNRFGSLKNIRTAGKEDLLGVGGLNEKTAERIISHFREDGA